MSMTSRAVAGTILALTLQTALTQAAPSKDKRNIIRVLVSESRRVLSISGLELRLNGTDLTSDKYRVLLTCRKNGTIQMGKGIFEKSVSIGSKTGFMHFDGKLFRNRLVIHSVSGLCKVVNHVDVEDYLVGLINREISSSWPIEAIKSQAVAARTYALYQKSVSSKSKYDIRSTVSDQVYDGAMFEDGRARRAIDETRGLVLKHGNYLAKTFYHSSSGGKTTTPEEVWGDRNYPYYVPVKDPFSISSPYGKWTYSLPLSFLQKKLERNGWKTGRILSVIPRHSGKSKRVSSIDVNGTSLRVNIPGYTLRNWFGNAKIKSTMFSTHIVNGTLYLSGNGSGHGIGMCQWGARVLAQRGKTFRQILKYYYPLLKLKNYL